MRTNVAGFSDDELIVLDILRTNIRTGSSEAEEYKQHLPEQAVRNATPDSLRAFIQVHNTLADLVGNDHYRTRHTGRTSTRGYGIAYYTHPFGNRQKGRGEIQGILLPTRDDYSGLLEAYLVGHRHAPVEGAIHTGETRAGFPVFRVTLRPNPDYVNNLINEFRNSTLFPDIRGIFGGLV